MRLVPVCLFALLCCACPGQVELQSGPPKAATPEVDENDPRVARRGDDLYQASVLERAERRRRFTKDPAAALAVPKAANPTACQLYRGKLEDPRCCVIPTGFDREVVDAACGAKPYLGEAFHRSCGYHFQAEGGEAVFRVKFDQRETTKAAVESDNRFMAKMFKGAASPAEPIPGIPDAYWNQHEGLNWAFIGGWSRVRRVTWRDNGCSREGMKTVLRKMIEAKEPDA